MDFGVGQAGVVVDGVVQVGVAVATLTGVAAAGGSAEDLVPAAVGDVAQLLMSTCTRSPGAECS
jgi:hypothetical protein